VPAHADWGPGAGRLLGAVQARWYSGLCVCGHVWDCPVCAAKIAERRRGELRLAMDAGAVQGLQPVLTTLTVRHHEGDDLMGLLKGMRQAQAALRRTSGYRSLLGAVGR